MTMSIAKADAGASIARAEDGLTQEQVELIRNTIAKGATNGELALFIQTAKRLRLDPFARQIFLVKRWDSQLKGLVATPQVSIDGLRLVAERTREYRGQTKPEWCGKDGKWTDVWLSDEPPSAARVGVYRTGFAEPMVRIALYKSYVQLSKEGKPNAMWAKYPEVMLAKCAESLALRSAFPNETSGVYTIEEWPEPEAQPASRPSVEQRLDDVARGGERAEGRPTSQGGASTAAPEDTSRATATTSTTEAGPAQTAQGGAAETGELLDAKAWRARYEALASDMAGLGMSFGGEDEHHLPIPACDEPVFGSKSKTWAGKRYSAAPVGLLRKMASDARFDEQAAGQRLWALYLIARHELAKETNHVTSEA